MSEEKKRRLRAPIPYYGGKGAMIAKLLRLVPSGGRPYCEPFMGAASLFFARKPAPVEVLNDLNDNVVALFRVLQDRRLSRRLQERLWYTLYARAEFIKALQILQQQTWQDEIDRAWAVMVAYSFGSTHSIHRVSAGSWSRAFVCHGGRAINVNNWLLRCARIGDWHDRLRMAQIDNRDALTVIKYWDNEDAVFYCDPPYIHDTRKNLNVYEHECDNTYHADLVRVLLDCKGAVVISGYPSEIYTPLEHAGWEKREFSTACMAAVRTRNSGLQGKENLLKKVPRTEVVWRNVKAVQLCNEQSLQLSQ